MLLFHKYRCEVHRPKPLLRQSTKFHSTLIPVTEENKSFWKGDPPLGGSICNECFSQFTNCDRNNLKQTETLPNENMV